MSTLESLTERVPEHARDLKLNLGAVLGDGRLAEPLRYAIALASALTNRHGSLATALEAALRARAGEHADKYIDDARAAVALMGMNNVYYRFRSKIGKDSYGQKPARLRMQRIAKPATTKAEFELVCLAVSAINNCETCVKSHEHEVLSAGLDEDQVHDAVRIAAVINGLSLALDDR
ncbi:MAG: carboxymuconolactone decarboxylase family protein [Myxococcales bacterium]|nr:carboxymuconolactone decarboxylase family protein [Myxococcales bacterium]